MPICIYFWLHKINIHCIYESTPTYIVMHVFAYISIAITISHQKADWFRMSYDMKTFPLTIITDTNSETRLILFITFTFLLYSATKWTQWENNLLYLILSGLVYIMYYSKKSFLGWKKPFFLMKMDFRYIVSVKALT